MEKIAIICVGNRLMLDDGIGPAVFDELTEKYSFPEHVSLFDAGCMTMDLLPVVRDHDFLIVVDAVDGTGEKPGTVFRFAPEDIAGHPVMQSLHDLRVIDLLNAASLLGYEARGICREHDARHDHRGTDARRLRGAAARGRFRACRARAPRRELFECGWHAVRTSDAAGRACERPVRRMLRRRSRFLCAHERIGAVRHMRAICA